ncbi:filamentous hemagglutinin N-terminal domain-containing protein, partial [Phormidium sp. CCY1219]|uniref:filamentous hemagglutinin N-terminal domain-containing protein n=1 Tax=Phormidium sp. CCY1219 TaxID=2886104 RepID=UPI002D1EBBF8
MMKKNQFGVGWSFPLLFALIFSGQTDAHAQAIAPAVDGTNTQVTTNGNQFDIHGGQLSSDGANLFHSFERFNVNPGEIANFQSNPSLENIVGRVVGGDASRIHGLIQVTGGNANLFLTNPTGILFGPNARLNVPGDFFATSATGIGFENGNWFRAIGDNQWGELVGEPSRFAFPDAAGAIANFAHLSVQPQRNLTLLGGSVLNAGTLSAPGGNITIAAIPGENLVRISQPHHLLSLEVNSHDADSSLNSNIAPLSLPELLTGGEGMHADRARVNPDGTILIAGSGVSVDPQTGDAIASGTLDVSGGRGNINLGGNASIMGNRVALFDATINASGTQGGGKVLVGGDIGGGTPEQLQASHTLVDRNSHINLDAIDNGNGGTAVLWGNNITQFYGSITARGGANPTANYQPQNGGFVEISGREFLEFNGTVNTLATHGISGTLLLDPSDIEIVSSGGNTTDLTQVDEFRDTPDSSSRIDVELINNATSNVTLQADNDITFNAAVNIATNGIGLNAEAGNRIAVNRRIQTNNGPITLTANGSAGGGIEVSANSGGIHSGGGNIRLSAPNSNATGIGIQAGEIVSNGGNVILNSSADIEAISIDARGGSDRPGGTVEISTGRFLRIIGNFSDRNGNPIAISTAGEQGIGSITIRHGGNGETPFVVGDASRNGSQGAIVTGSDAIASGTFLQSTNRGRINITTAIASQPAPQEPAPNQQPAPQQPAPQQPASNQPSQNQPPGNQQPPPNQPSQNQPPG